MDVLMLCASLYDSTRDSLLPRHAIDRNGFRNPITDDDDDERKPCHDRIVAGIDSRSIQLGVA
jgi:hypothetical protein